MTETAAETLRRAAALIRERAEAATPGPWRALMDGYGDTSNWQPGENMEKRRDLFWVRSGPGSQGDIVSTYGDWSERSAEDVTHIASWPPAVTLAVADSLDVAAYGACCDECMNDPDVDPFRYAALTVARAYLREDGDYQ